MKATKIKMKPGCGETNNLFEIDAIYLTGCKVEGYYKKDKVHEYLINNPGAIQVNIPPYPNFIPAISKNEEKYVKSTPNIFFKDNLLCLPKE